jgi:hypothetical protein
MMNSFPGMIESARLGMRSRLALPILICFHIIVCCVSLVHVSHYQSYMHYDGDRLYYAVIAVAAFSVISSLFLVARFSFGYFVGFYFYTMVLGFLWLVCFTKYNYDHKMAGLSAAVSMLLFLLPALLIDAPIKQVFALSTLTFERLLGFILVLSMATIVAASIYNFRIVSLDHIYDFRNDLHFPTFINYSIGIVSSTLLPFVFACYLTLNYRWRAGITLLLMLLFYPITLSKLAFFAPAWIVALLIFSKIFEARTATILSLFFPLLVGVILVAVLPIGDHPFTYFDKVNIRMIATPSSAMDIYNDFFSNHPHTFFCQISFLKPLMSCPYQDQLSVVMEKAYGFGNLNASLFATEGIASVGLFFAPLSAFACGLVIALGNRLSAGLPPRFILISGALLPQVLLNVPLTTALLTHGAAVLFLLWYITPRAMFESKDRIKALASNGPLNVEAAVATTA